MPVYREGRYVVSTPEELNAWLGKASGKPIAVATENIDLAAELKRGLAFIKNEKGAKAAKSVQESEAPMKKPIIRITKWLADIPIEATCTACPSVSFRAKGSSHRPNREEYQSSLQVQFDTHCKAEHGFNRA